MAQSLKAKKGQEKKIWGLIMEREHTPKFGNFDFLFNVLPYKEAHFKPCCLVNCHGRHYRCNGVSCPWLVEEQGRDGQRQKQMGYFNG